MATKQAAKIFSEVAAHRRSIYALSNKPILPDQQVVKLVQTALREAPSAFNVQSSRAAVLFGKDHSAYWNKIVPDALLKVAGQKAVDASKPKLDGFSKGYGTILFFEENKLIKGQQESLPAYASSFPIWSLHASGMAQIYTWTLLEAEGYGANLQHYGNLTGETLKEKYNLPESYQLQSEMVFGFPEQPAGAKTSLPDAERVVSFGAN